MRKTKLAFIGLAMFSMAIVACGDDPNTDTTVCEKHKFGGWEVVTPAACEVAGEQKRTCSVCGTVETKPIAALKHVWDDGVYSVEPTATTPGKMTATCLTCGKTDEQDVPAYTDNYKTVTYKNADGSQIKTRKYEVNKSFREPAHPAAPEGKVFYGWKNAANGGQIWNFTDETLSLLLDDITLEAVFVPKGINPQYLECELVPAITDGAGMDGATYSGGANGKQFIRSDENHQYGSTCEVEKFGYYDDPRTLKIGSCASDAVLWACDTCGEVINSATKPETCPNASESGHDADYEFDSLSVKTYSPKEENAGYFVHFNYKKGNVMTFNIHSDKAVDDVIIFASFSAEYGVINPETNDRYCSFSDTSFPIAVNGVDMPYGTVTMHNIPAIGDFLYFQDYLIGMNISLNAGDNVITMTVNNEDTLNGTIASTSPCIDSLKIFTSATITWPEAKLSNLIKNSN